LGGKGFKKFVWETGAWVKVFKFNGNFWGFLWGTFGAKETLRKVPGGKGVKAFGGI